MAGRAQEIPLENCRQLPIVKATVEKRAFQFLLDTGAATTLLNVKSFSSPETAEITMESWNGAAGTPAPAPVTWTLRIEDHGPCTRSLLTAWTRQKYVPAASPLTVSCVAGAVTEFCRAILTNVDDELTCQL